MQNREPTRVKKTEDGKHFIHWFIHPFLPIVMCLPGARHYSKHWGSTCRQDSSFYQASFLIGEAENQQIEQRDRKNRGGCGKARRAGTWHWRQETGSQDGTAHQRVQPRSHRKTVFLPKGVSPDYFSQIPIQ